jgi:pyridoxal phosphate-dependent aminotransferase EpsN
MLNINYNIKIEGICIMNDSNKRIYISPPSLSGNEIKYVTSAIESNWIAPAGPDITLFENDIAGLIGVSNAVGVSAGAAAIHLCLIYLGIKEGDNVFCSDLTFAGSCNPIAYLKATPAFIDSDEDSWNMSPIALEKAFVSAVKNNKMPKAVIIVDLYGQSAKFDELLEICNRYHVTVIEDSAEALGASYKGKKCGSFGKYSIFSFNGNKIITTSGGGMIVSDDKSALDKMKYLSTQAKLPFYHYEHTEIGYNYRMSNICAVLGKAQIEGLRHKIQRRHEIYDFYKQSFSDIPVQMMPIFAGSEPNYWLSVFTIDKSSGVSPIKILETLNEHNIESRPIWKPMHRQPVFKGCEFFDVRMDEDKTKCVSESIYERGLCLPSGNAMTLEEQQSVIDIVKACFR